MIEFDISQDKKILYSQYFTPCNICEDIVSRIIGVQNDVLFIEPSFGCGNFITKISKTYPQNKIYGFDIDNEYVKSCRDIFNKNDNIVIENKNFYDVLYGDIPDADSLIFIGNPPFKSPAQSLTTHRSQIKQLLQKYELKGIREEAALFLLKTIDIIKEKKVNGRIIYILPKTIFTNNSKFYQPFKKFIQQNLRIHSINEIESSEFQNVVKSMVVLDATVCLSNVENKHINIQTSLSDYFRLNDITDEIPYQKIFKKTYLGSVPCESLLMSITGETIEQFKNRLVSILSDASQTIDKLYNGLQFNGQFHLNLLNRKPKDNQLVQEKLSTILSYVINIQNNPNVTLNDFNNIGNYKEITNRNDTTLFYFRHNELKKKYSNFVYELNPNPQPSFYFCSNPSNTSTDYTGFCSYDVNRNISPGCGRTVPINGLEDNLTDFFKEYWTANTDKPFEKIFDYISFITKSQWHKDRKKKYERFYFSIPKQFIFNDIWCK